jgi:hypothetical protein
MDLYSLVVRGQLRRGRDWDYFGQATGTQFNKPAWRPPDWLFAPVRTILYASIALSGWLVWREAGTAGAALPLGVYAVQLLLNAGRFCHHRWNLLKPAGLRNRAGSEGDMT